MHRDLICEYAVKSGMNFNEKMQFIHNGTMISAFLYKIAREAYGKEGGEYFNHLLDQEFATEEKEMNKSQKDIVSTFIHILAGGKR